MFFNPGDLVRERDGTEIMVVECCDHAQGRVWVRGKRDYFMAGMLIVILAVGQIAGRGGEHDRAEDYERQGYLDGRSVSGVGTTITYDRGNDSERHG